MPEIRFRAVEPADADLLFTTENDEDSWGDSDLIAPLSRNILRSYAENYTSDPIRDGQLRLIAEDYNSGEVVGILDFYQLELLHRHSFLAIYVLPSYRRQGYAYEILQRGRHYAYNRLGLHTLAAKILSDNTLSHRLFLKADYKKCGTLPSWHFANGTLTDVDLFVLPL
ncbi:MAG: GNAT family N-acetyltransferase [Muribaculaceae bacterium]|nr:GNAT family N-acetyltransferase [Muribaculaceae bacterium]